MRTKLTLISLITLASTTAFAQWEVRPAPSSWNLPQSSAPKAGANSDQRRREASLQTPVQTVPRLQARSNAAPNLTDAVSCSAALQLATMAAPSWAGERGITNITNAWLQKVFALGEAEGVAGDKVPGLVEAEMQRQIEGAAADAASLSRRAFDCASRQP